MEPEAGDAPLQIPGGRVGVFGGTFDPPHVGHLVVARDVAEALELDAVLWMPAGQPPHKAGAGVTPANHRLDMVRAAVADAPAFQVSTVETDRSGPSYTVDTLRALRRSAPGVGFHLILGADQYRALGSWREPGEVGRLAALVVMDRDGALDSAPDPGVDVEATVVAVTRLDISSTDVRTRVREGRSVRYLVPDPVRRIIEDRGLYARGS